MTLQHPSLTRSFTAPPALEPKITMKPNEKCWCNSGVKWKKCHKEREQQRQPDIKEILAQMAKKSIKSYCSHPEASDNNCSRKIARAHSIQKAKGIKSIAENNHVLSIKEAFMNSQRNNNKLKPTSIGINKASTFMGFCSFHDSAMFKSVEVNNPALNIETIFLLSFRALSYELFAKINAAERLNILRDSDKGVSFPEQCTIQQRLNIIHHGQQKGIEDLQKWKSNYDRIFLSKNYDEYNFYGVQFSLELPLVACGLFSPEYDFDGNALQIISRATSDLEHLAINLTTLGSYSILSFGWKKNNTQITQFVKSFAKLKENEKASALVRILFEYIENTYLRPSWWESLSTSLQDDAIERMCRTIGHSSTSLLQKTKQPYLNNISIKKEFSNI